MPKTISFSFFFKCSGDHRDLHVLTHSFPTRRSSDLDEVEFIATPLPTTTTTTTTTLRSEEHTSELQSLRRISYAVFCLKKKNRKIPRARIQTQPPSQHRADRGDHG